MPADRDPVPVLVVTGFLGAGKTTLINRILMADHGRTLAAVVNDFGAINIDETILSSTGQPIYGLKNGCICCTLQGDLLRTLRTILAHDADPDAIIIEASGVSDPRGIIEALFDPVLSQAVRLDSVITVVDAENYDPADDLWAAQVGAADFVVIAKGKGLSQTALATLDGFLKGLRADATVFSDEAGGVPIELFFGTGSRRQASRTAVPFAHIKDDRFARLEWTCARPISLARFQSAVQSFAPQLVRAKGVLSIEERPGQGLLFQLVGRRASLSPAPQAVDGTMIVFIGKADRFDPQLAIAALEALKQGSRR